MILTNPLLQKEFRQRMRTKRAPFVITGYLLFMVALTFGLLYESLQGQTIISLTVRSEQIFVALSWLQMAIAAFLTPAFAAGSVSGERERRTLPVLMTTPLTPLGVIVGKILSSSSTAWSLEWMGTARRQEEYPPRSCTCSTTLCRCWTPYFE